MAIAPVPLVLPIVIAEKPSAKRPSSASSSSNEHTAPPQEVAVIELPKPMVVPAVLDWITRAALPDRVPPKLIASVVRVKALPLAAIVEPVVMLEAESVNAAPTVVAPV